MELRSRSRSKTPFQTQSFIKAESFEGSNHVTVTRSSRRTTTVRTRASGGIASSSEELYTSSKPSVKTKSTKSLKNIASTFKTSDYSSEEGEIDSLSHITENEKNQIIEDAKAAANGNTEISALSLYRRAGRYWDKYPKTDYTYSPHSRDRVELAPGVVQMPNMSRRTIHSYDSSTNTDSYFDRFVSRSQYAKQRLFSSSNNNEEVTDESFKISRVSSSSQKRTLVSVITTFFVNVYSTLFWCFYSVYEVLNSSTIWVLKKLHHTASRVMLFDTWLLKKSPGSKKTRALIALCLLPLLVFAAWWLLSSLGSAIYWSYFSPSNNPVEVLPPIAAPIVHIEENQPPPRPEITPQMPLGSKFNNLDHLTTDEIVEKVIQSPKIHNIINNYHQNIAHQSDSEREQKLLNLVNQLREEITNVKKELTVLEQAKHADLTKIISQIRTENVRNVAQLTQKLHRCCNKPMIDLEAHISASLGKLLNDPEFLASQRGLTDWLHSLFLAKEELEVRLANLTQALSKDFDSSIEKTAEKVMDKVVAKLTNHRFEPGAITEEQIKRVVKSSLAVYDADKTGLVDYAMEPMGGQIVTTRCTESYHTGTAVISVLGVPLWYPSNTPRIVITPGINPGECWAFQNFPGFVVIKLASRIRVEAFSLEHVSKLLVPEGRIDSAPKEFEVYGLSEENEQDPVKLGEYVYDYDGDSLQFFAAHQHGLVFSMVEVRIKSNHGNPNYTCLYRFRVHGTPSNEPT